MSKELLLQILGTPSCSGEEIHIIKLIEKRLQLLSVDYYKDKYNNIYATKGKSSSFPCICCHTDTVFEIRDYTVVEKVENGKTIFSGIDNYGEEYGIGADDKTGIYICLELLRQLDNIKVVFFATEEPGCIGAKKMDKSFFTNVSYALEFDCPGIDSISYELNDVPLFEWNSTFGSTVKLILDSFGIINYESHPFTDVLWIRNYFKIPTINLPAGYYNQHYYCEYAVWEDINKAVKLGIKLIGELENKKIFTDEIKHEIIP